MVPNFVKLAYEWYNGQWSALYKFACNGGRIFDLEHAIDLESEINDCLYRFGNSCKNDDDLKEFLEYVKRTPNEYDSRTKVKEGTVQLDDGSPSVSS